MTGPDVHGDRNEPSGAVPILPGRHRALVVADIHSNIQALDAVLAHVRGQGGFTEVWVLGDVMGYGPNPNEVVTRPRDLQASGIPVRAVGGNHDHAVVGKRDAHRTMGGHPAVASDWTAGVIDAVSHAWLEALPDTVEVGPVDRRGVPLFTLVHGVPTSPQDRYTHERGQARRALGQIATRHLVTGHTHLLLALRFADDQIGTVHPDRLRTGNGTSFEIAGGRFVLNPGSVGQPRDGDPRASCLVLDFGATESEGVVVAVHRVSYDIATVQSRIREAGLPRYPRDRLADRKDEWTDWMVVTGDAWLQRDAVDAPPAPFPARHGIRSRARVRQNRCVRPAQ